MPIKSPFFCLLTPRPALVRSVVFLLLVSLFILLPGFGLPESAWSGAVPEVTVAASVLSDYRVDSYRIDCEISPDGQVVVQEKLDLFYQQESKELAFFLSTGKARSLKLLSVAISAGSPADSTPVQLVEVLPADSKTQANLQSLSYSLNADGLNDRLKIRSVGHANETRQVVIRYQLDGALVQLTDAIKFRRSFFALAGDKTIAKPVLMIHYPQGAQADSVWSRPVSPIAFMTTEVDADTVQMSAPQLLAKQKMEAVLILPVSGFAPGAALLPQGTVGNRAAVIAEIEQELARMSQLAWADAFLSRLTWILLTLAVFILTILFLVFEREGLLRLPLDRGLPKGPVAIPVHRPAILARLSRHHHPGQILLATLLDLVIRGKLRLDGHVFTLLAHSVPDYQGMSAYEIFLLQWFYERITKENTLAPAQIRKYALDRRTAAEFAAYYEQFILLIQEDMVKEGLLDLPKRHQGKLLGLVMAGFYASASLCIVLVTRSLPGLVLLVPALLFAGFALGLKHLTRQGNLEAAKARHLRQQIRHYASLKKGQPAEPRLDSDLLAPAIALGADKPYLRQLTELYHQDQSLARAFMAQLTQSQINDSEHLAGFARDLDAMGSMLSASLYLALGVHFYD